jgi:Flp pilus assembly pilin Flp
MQTILQFIRDLRHDQRGQDMVEYALVAGLAVSAAMAISPAIASTATYFGHVTQVLAQLAAATAAR